MWYRRRWNMHEVKDVHIVMKIACGGEYKMCTLYNIDEG